MLKNASDDMADGGRMMAKTAPDFAISISHSPPGRAFSAAC
jgi:hypothetical protein